MVSSTLLLSTQMASDTSLKDAQMVIGMLLMGKVGFVSFLSHTFFKSLCPSVGHKVLNNRT